LAQRIGESTAWREFTLYRAAPRDGNVTVTFALSGMGEAWLDEVTVTLLNPTTRHATLGSEGDRQSSALGR
jgi:hypothetical protein